MSRISTPRRPPGWIAPGPRPAGAGDDSTLVPGEDETLDMLSGDWRIFQKRRGHRWSLDDLVTAWLACDGVDAPTRYVDLGCGIGSVLSLVAWRFERAQGVGIEAQEISAGLAERTLRYNGAAERVDVRVGDFRRLAVDLEAGSYPLVTGTPPYWAEGSHTCTDHARPQAFACRFETRGGVREYMRAARLLLSPRGRFTMCAGAFQRAEVEAQAAECGLRIERTLDVVPKEGKAPLIALFRFMWDDAGAVGSEAPEAPLIVRDASGERTAAMRAVRTAFGIPW